jgi:hypothetical protein
MDQPEISDFSYWNNSDRPDGITAREWEHRHKVWDKILISGPDAVPAMRGLTAQCTSDSLYVGADDIVAAIKPHEVRVRNLARIATMDVDMRRRMTGLSDAEVKATVFEVYHDVERWLRSDEGKASFQAKIDELEGVLPKTLTKEMLLERRPTPVEPDASTGD